MTQPLPHFTRRTLLKASAVLLPTVAGAQQQAWPAKPLTIIVPYSAGGSLDLTTRLVAQRLSERLQQNVLVENATGAGGSVGIQKAIKSAPDGYTLLMAGDAPLNPAPAAGQSAYRHDMQTELVPLGLVNTAPMVLVAHPSFGANNFSEFLALARANPGKFNYATSGIGTILHLTMELVKAQGKIFAVHIPYRGGALIVNDVVGKQIDMALLINASALPAIKSGALKALAVTSERRLPWLPNVPAIAESAGFKGLDIASWAGLYAPVGTPAPVVSRLSQELNAVLKMEPVRTRLSEFGAVPGGGSPQDFNQFIAQDRAKFAKTVRSVALS
jgi:tripartite-type tricarboxylate transporter receptor subunit TctC